MNDNDIKQEIIDFSTLMNKRIVNGVYDKNDEKINLDKEHIINIYNYMFDSIRDFHEELLYKNYYRGEYNEEDDMKKILIDIALFAMTIHKRAME